MRRVDPRQLELFANDARSPTPMSRATSTRSKHREAPAPRPWECVVLAIDTAKRSGHATGVRGRLVGSGEVDTLDEPTLDLIVCKAVELAAYNSLPIVLVLEAPFGGRANVVASLGVARERWLRAWRAQDEARARVVFVLPSEWRGPVLGGEWASAPREAVRAHEMRTARALTQCSVIGPDEAAAILIARWAAHSARVGKAIGKRASKASLREWTKVRT